MRPTGEGGVAALIPIASAAVAWLRSRRRLVDGRLAFSVVVGEDGEGLLRVQNIGETMCLIRYAFTYGMDAEATDTGPMNLALPPGGMAVVKAHGMYRKSELVAMYMTTSDARLVWVARCRLEEADVGPFSVEPWRSLPRRARREIVFDDTAPLFLEVGMGRLLRLIRLGRPGADWPTLRHFVQGLTMDGYRRIAP